MKIRDYVQVLAWTSIFIEAWMMILGFLPNTVASVTAQVLGIIFFLLVALFGSVAADTHSKGEK